MHTWPVQDAKAKLSEFLVQAAAHPSLKQLLLADTARTNELIPVRGHAKRRQIDENFRSWNIL